MCGGQLCRAAAGLQQGGACSRCCAWLVLWWGWYGVSPVHGSRQCGVARSWQGVAAALVSFRASQVALPGCVRWCRCCGQGRYSCGGLAPARRPPPRCVWVQGGLGRACVCVGVGRVTEELLRLVCSALGAGLYLAVCCAAVPRRGCIACCSLLQRVCSPRCGAVCSSRGGGVQAAAPARGSSACRQ
jgi:hypothetical protein